MLFYLNCLKQLKYYTTCVKECDQLFISVYTVFLYRFIPYLYRLVFMDIFIIKRNKDTEYWIIFSNNN